MFQIRVGDKLYTTDSQQASNSTPFGFATARAWLQWFSAIYLIVGIAYVVYGVSTQTGLGGYAMAIEMETLGYAGPKATATLLLMLLILPLLAVIGLLSRLSPQLVNSGRKPRSEREYVLVLPWKRVLCISAIPLLAAALVAPIAYFAEQHELKEPVYEVNLDDANGSIPKQSNFVALTGRPAPYVAAYREGDTDHVFAPMTGSAWTPAEAVRFIAYETVSLSRENQPFTMPDDFNRRVPTRIKGKISRLLPSVIERKYNARGLNIASSCVVVDTTSFPSASDPDFAAFITGILGTALTMLVLFTLIMLKVTRKSVRF